MRRRELLNLLGGAAVSWPGGLSAATGRFRVGVLTLLSPQDEGGRISAFLGGLRQLGYVQGENIDIDIRHAEGQTEKLQPLALELLAQKPDVIFAGEPSAARAVKALTSDLPIVCPSLTDRLPDLFESYSRPGGNVTGVAAILEEDLNGKLVQLAIEVIPTSTASAFS